MHHFHNSGSARILVVSPIFICTGHLMYTLSQFDYMLHLDGTIEVRVSASGYLQGAFWESAQEGYGTRIRDTTCQYIRNFLRGRYLMGLKLEVFTTTSLITR